MGESSLESYLKREQPPIRVVVCYQPDNLGELYHKVLYGLVKMHYLDREWYEYEEIGEIFDDSKLLHG